MECSRRTTPVSCASRMGPRLAKIQQKNGPELAPSTAGHPVISASCRPCPPAWDVDIAVPKTDRQIFHTMPHPALAIDCMLCCQPFGNGTVATQLPDCRLTGSYIATVRLNYCHPAFHPNIPLLKEAKAEYAKLQNHSSQVRASVRARSAISSSRLHLRYVSDVPQ